MTISLTEQARLKTLADLRTRRERHSLISRVATQDQQAGEPITFYCTSCGQELETKDELYLFAPRSLCSECQGMEDYGWLDKLRPFPSQGGENTYCR